MSSEEQELNPYAAPNETGKTTKRIKKKAPEVENDDSILQDIIRAFQKTRSWVSLFAGLSRVAAALHVIAGIFMAFLAARGEGRMAVFGPSLGPPVALAIYVLLGAIYAVLSWRLFRYRDAISNLIRNDGRLDSIADAVEQQARFWAWAGQTAVVLFVMSIVAALIGLMME